jgi:hypothetical protein
MAREERGPSYKLRDIASFQHFDPRGAFDLAMQIGRQVGEIGDQVAADKWFAVAAANAAGKHPPDQEYCARSAAALRANAAALTVLADRIDKEIEQQALDVQNAKAAAERKRLQQEGQKNLPKNGTAGSPGAN